MTEDKPRAQLAQPEPEGLTDEEIEEWADACYEVPLEITGTRVERLQQISKTIRAALVRWGHPTPQPPADGEVAELVEWLRSIKSLQAQRAATLLQQLSAAAPAAVPDGPAAQSKEPASVAPEATGPRLCTAAQAALDAFAADNYGVWLEGDPDRLAAAIRAVADQVVPVTSKPNDEFCCPSVETIVWNRVMKIRKHFLAIADELEGANA